MNINDSLPNIFLTTLCLCGVIFANGCASVANNTSKGYSVAAYVWPSCHDEPMSREALWGDGPGEWQIIKKGTPRFEGHYQPRVPLWGYAQDNDPIAWEKKINAATDHGVNVFIFDWYWYGGKPFLEEAVDKGFLQAKNNGKAKFYLMWANHDADGHLWNPYQYTNRTVLWPGAADWPNFKLVVDRVINQYFKHPSYFKIDGQPVFSIYSLTDLVKGFTNITETRKALDYFRAEVKKAGFPGLHLQGIGHGMETPFLLGGKDGGRLTEGRSVNQIVSDLGLDSVTMYNWCASSGLQDYLRYGERAVALRSKWDATLKVPFFPCTSVGWDNSPRLLDAGKESIIHLHSTPASFAAYLQKAKDYADQHPQQKKLIIINAWNEWVEGSYLEPDMLWGYGYLEAVKKVMTGTYDK